MANLNNFPTELLINISDYLPTESILSLRLTCRSLADRLSRSLYNRFHNRSFTTISSPLHWACYSGSLAAARFLIAQGAPLSEWDTHRRTPLHLCVWNFPDMPDCVHIARLLLINGADVSALAKFQWSMWTPLHICAWLSRYPDALTMAQLLLDHGAEVNAIGQDRWQRTPLHVAVKPDGDAGDVTFVNLLLENGADTAMVDIYGRTALHLACCSGKWARRGVIRALLLKGAKGGIKDLEGITPLMMVGRRYAPVFLLWWAYGKSERRKAATESQNKEPDLVEDP